MGFKTTDLFPPGGVTAITPASKPGHNELFQVTRADTVATLKQVLPADASILTFTFYGSVVSNAATTATVTITVTNNSGTIGTGTYDVKTNGATTGVVQVSNLPNLEAFPLQGDLKITAQYTETGTASTAGGPWVIGVQFVR